MATNKITSGLTATNSAAMLAGQANSSAADAFRYAPELHRNIPAPYPDIASPTIADSYDALDTVVNVLVTLVHGTVENVSKFQIVNHGVSRSIVFTGNEELTVFKVGSGMTAEKAVDFMAWVGVLPK